MADGAHVYRDEREEARARLRSSVDALAHQASLQTQMQKEPLKLLGGASAVGAVVGLVVGRQLRGSKKVYVDAYSPEKEQKALLKAQKKQKGGGVGGALVATLTTMAFKALNDKVITPRLEEMANSMLDRAGQPGQRTGTPGKSPAAAPQPAAAPRAVTGGGAAAFLKHHPEAQSSADTVPGQTAHTVSSALPTPVSRVEAKAEGSPIAEGEKANPNLR